MKKISRTLLTCGFIASMTLPFYSAANAQDANFANDLHHIRLGVSYLASQLKPTLTVLQSQNYQAAFDAGATIAANQSNLNVARLIGDVKHFSLKYKMGSLINNADQVTITDPSTKTTSQSTLFNAVNNYFADIPASDYPLISPSKPTVIYTGVGEVNLGAKKANGDKNFNANSLLGPLVYKFGANSGNDLNYFLTTTKSQLPRTVVNYKREEYTGTTETSQNAQVQIPLPVDHAMNYIYYLSGVPFQTLSIFSNFGSGISFSDLEKIGAYKDYRLAVRNYAALRSLALTTLYHSYFERVPVKNLAKRAGIPQSEDSMYPYASQLQVEHYNATRRLSPQWYSKMAAAPPATIMREQLYLMAEMRYAQYQQSMEIEQQNDLLAALLLTTANSGIGGNNLNSLRDEVNETLHPQGKTPGSISTPGDNNNPNAINSNQQNQ